MSFIPIPSEYLRVSYKHRILKIQITAPGIFCGMNAKPMMDGVIVDVVNNQFKIPFILNNLSPESMFKQASRTMVFLINGLGVGVKQVGKTLMVYKTFRV